MGAAGTDNRQLQALEEHPPVGQAGQRVVLGQVVEGIAALVELVEVLDDFLLHLLEAARQLAQFIPAAQRQRADGAVFGEALDGVHHVVQRPGQGAGRQCREQQAEQAEHGHDLGDAPGQGADIAHDKVGGLGQAEDHLAFAGIIVQRQAHKGADQLAVGIGVVEAGGHQGRAAAVQQAVDRGEIALQENALTAVEAECQAGVGVNQNVAHLVAQVHLVLTRQVGLELLEQLVEVDVQHDQVADAGAVGIAGAGDGQGRLVQTGVGALFVVDHDGGQAHLAGFEAQGSEYIGEVGFLLQLQAFYAGQLLTVTLDADAFLAVFGKADQANLQVFGVHLEQAAEGRRQFVVGVLAGRRLAAELAGLRQAGEQAHILAGAGQAGLQAAAEHLGGRQQVALGGIQEHGPAAAVGVIAGQAADEDAEHGEQAGEFEAHAEVHGVSRAGRLSPERIRVQRLVRRAASSTGSSQTILSRLLLSAGASRVLARPWRRVSSLLIRGSRVKSIQCCASCGFFAPRLMAQQSSQARAPSLGIT